MVLMDRTTSDKINAMFESDFKWNYHLAPPLTARKNDNGELGLKQKVPAAHVNTAETAT